MRIASWVVEEPGQPDGRETRDEDPGPGEVLIVEVAGCGVCHTDLGLLLRRRAHAASVPAHARPRDQRHAWSRPAPAPRPGSAARWSCRR